MSNDIQSAHPYYQFTILYTFFSELNLLIIVHKNNCIYLRFLVRLSTHIPGRAITVRFTLLLWRLDFNFYALLLEPRTDLKI